MGSLLGSTSLGQALMTLVSFLILLYCVRRFAWKPLMDILQQRKQMIDKDIKEGRQLKESSQRANKEAQATLREAKVTANKILADAKKQLSQARTAKGGSVNQQAISTLQGAVLDREKNIQALQRELGRM